MWVDSKGNRLAERGMYEWIGPNSLASMHLLLLGFHVLAPAIGDGSNNKLAGLTETVTPQWPTCNEGEVPEYPWHNVETI